MVMRTVKFNYDNVAVDLCGPTFDLLGLLCIRNQEVNPKA